MTIWNKHTKPEGRVYALVLWDHALPPSVMQYDPSTQEWVGEDCHSWVRFDQASWAKLPYHESLDPKLFAVEDPK